MLVPGNSKLPDVYGGDRLVRHCETNHGQAGRTTSTTAVFVATFTTKPFLGTLVPDRLPP